MKRYDRARRAARIAALALSATLLTPVTARAGAVGSLAAQMQPGTWATLQTIGLSRTLLDVGTSFILNYTDDAAWDPATRQFFFIGAGHGDQTGGLLTRFIKYNEDTNTWSQLYVPPELFILGHAYDQTTIGPGYFYHHKYNSNVVYRYNIQTNTWSSLPPYPSNYQPGTGGLSYFPEMNGLVYSDGKDKGLNNAMALFYDLGTSQWRALATNLEFGDYHTFSKYNPVHHVVLFGGGEWYQAGTSRQMYKLDASGAITKLRDAPIDLGIQNTIITADPVTGKYLVYYKDMTNWEYDVTNDSWRMVGSGGGIFTPPTLSSDPVTGTVATPVSNYGVSMFLRESGTDVWIYKGGPTPVGDTTPPRAPSNVTTR